MNNSNLKEMKITRLMVFLLVVAGCFLPGTMFGKNSDHEMKAMAQVQTDSIVAPNVFTPNGDQINDLFEVTSSDGNPVSLRVFTRAGVLVFSIEAKICQWDGYSSSGQEMANGVYYYTAEVVGSSPKITKKGFVHLYR